MALPRIDAQRAEALPASAMDLTIGADSITFDNEQWLRGLEASSDPEVKRFVAATKAEAPDLLEGRRIEVPVRAPRTRSGLIGPLFDVMAEAHDVGLTVTRQLEGMPEPLLTIHADRSAAADMVADVLRTADRAGFERFAVAVESAAGPRSLAVRGRTGSGNRTCEAASATPCRAVRLHLADAGVFVGLVPDTKSACVRADEPAAGASEILLVPGPGQCPSLRRTDGQLDLAGLDPLLAVASTIEKACPWIGLDPEGSVTWSEATTLLAALAPHGPVVLMRGGQGAPTDCGRAVTPADLPRALRGLDAAPAAAP